MGNSGLLSAGVDGCASQNELSVLYARKAVNRFYARGQSKGKRTKLFPVQQTFCAVQGLLPKIGVQVSPTGAVTPLRLAPSGPASSVTAVVVG